MFHFHRAGLYGVGANIIAIPLTTFVIMPLEAGALLLDVFGWGQPLWWLCGASIDGLLKLAHAAASAPRRGGAAAVDARLGVRLDGGGRHLAVPVEHAGPVARSGAVRCRRDRRGALARRRTCWSPATECIWRVVRDGTPLILRERAGDYVRALFAEASGFDGDPGDLGSRPYSACTKDACVALIRKGPVEWRLLATRSATQIDWTTLTRACADADIVVSSRRLPRGCTPRWLKLDRSALASTGGLAIYLGDRSVGRQRRRSGGRASRGRRPRR